MAPGYKPDLTVTNPEGQLIFVLEHENKSDRKCYLGDLVKAEKYAESRNSEPALIIAMKCRDILRYSRSPSIYALMQDGSPT